MVVGVGRVDVERHGELSVALEAEAFAVAGQCLFGVSRRGFRRVALDLLLDPLARTGYPQLVLAWPVLLAVERRVACVRTRMGATLLFAAELVARLAGIFALPRPMAGFLAAVESTFQLLAANLTAAHVCQPARLILQPAPAAHAVFGREKRTLWAVLAVHMTVVRHLRMAACLGSPAFKHTRRRLRAARQRRLQNRLTAVAADLVKDGFAAGIAKPTVTQLLTHVVSALQLPLTDASAYMLRLVVVQSSVGSGAQRSDLFLAG